MSQAVYSAPCADGGLDFAPPAVRSLSRASILGSPRPATVGAVGMTSAHRRFERCRHRRYVSGAPRGARSSDHHDAGAADGTTRFIVQLPAGRAMRRRLMQI